MTFTKLRNLFILMILCLTTVWGMDQQLKPLPQETQQKLTELYMKYNQLNQQLKQTQQQAMQDTKIAEKGEALDSRIKELMVKNNPSIKKTLDKREEIIASYKEAQQSGDQEAQQQLDQDFKNISQAIQVEQKKVMQQPEIQKDMNEFQTMLMEKMKEINPKTPELIDQTRQVQAQLMSLQQKAKN